ncbi:hypothetical protein OAO01_08880 [Oligoflexia bacterium]|nr:hypothetical protein [Oligoflexia bacterium]
MLSSGEQIDIGKAVANKEVDPSTYEQVVGVVETSFSDAVYQPSTATDRASNLGVLEPIMDEINTRALTNG